MKGGVSMAHFMKASSGASGGLTRHYERHKKDRERIEKEQKNVQKEQERILDENKENGAIEKIVKASESEYIKFGNQDIDTSRTHLNYNLAEHQKMPQLEFIKQRTSEVHCLNRKDVNIMCSWVVTLPKEITHPGEQDVFFEETYKFLEERYGKENVISAYVHLDESQPHIHFAFVPVVEDKQKGYLKVSAKERVNRADLQTFHKDLSKTLENVFGRDVGVLNQATKDKNKSVEELKAETKEKIVQFENKAKAEILATVDERKQQYDAEFKKFDKILENKEKQVKSEIFKLDKELQDKKSEVAEKIAEKSREILDFQKDTGEIFKTLDEINALTPKKSFTGAITGIELADVEKLIDTTKRFVGAEIWLKKTIVELKSVQAEKNDLEIKIPKIQERMEKAEMKVLELQSENKVVQGHYDQQRLRFKKLDNDFKALETEVHEVKALMNDYRNAFKQLPEDWQDQLGTELIDEYEEELESLAAEMDNPYRNVKSLDDYKELLNPSKSTSKSLDWDFER